MIHKALLCRDDTDIFYVSRKEGGRGFKSIEVCADATFKGLVQYRKHSKKDVIQQPVKVISAHRTNNKIIKSGKQICDPLSQHFRYLICSTVWLKQPTFVLVFYFT